MREPVESLPLSVVVPLYNERDNIEPLCAQIAAALDPVTDYEIVLVDDGSSDGSGELLADLNRRPGRVRTVRHFQNAGQSAALCTGVAAARGELIVTLDGDLQNDPSDIPKLLTAMGAAPDGQAHLIAGNRLQRRDNWLRRVSSRIANRVRSALLRDHCPDTGCSLKVFRRDTFLRLPQFDHMHRFLPALFAACGARVVNVPVSHRPRVAGNSKYGLGNRLWIGIVDLFGVRWLIRRAIPPTTPPRYPSISPRRSTTATQRRQPGEENE